MKKKLLYLLAALAVLGIGAYVCVAFFLGSVVKAGVNAVAPKITGTKVELNGAQISPFSGQGTLSGLTVGNPTGWTADKAFYLGKIHLSVKPFSIFGDHIVIEELIIDDPQFNYETKIVASNISDLLKNIEAATGGRSAETTATAKNGQPIKFEVKHFKMTNGKVTVGVGAAAFPLPMPTIELNDVGTKEGGITANQLAYAVMRSVTTGVVGATTQAAGKLIPTTGAAAADGIKKLFGGK